MTQNGADLPADRQKAVEQGLTMFQMVSAERDQLREELRCLKETLTQQRVEIESLHQLNTMLESHIQSYMLQRDLAIAERAAYETLFSTVQAQLRVFKIPAAPLIKGVQDEIPEVVSSGYRPRSAGAVSGRITSAVPNATTGKG